jgi:competence protein ComEC
VPRARPLLALALVVAIGLAAGGRLGTVLDRPADWQLAVCDVGQGDATLVRSEGQVALIDTGPDPELLGACLADLGISRIDLLVLSHYDADHVEGLAAVEGMVGAALVGPGGDDVIAAIGAPAQRAVRGMSGQLGELRWRIHWPLPTVTDPGNAASVVIGFDCVSGCLSSLFLGDLGADSQARMLAAGILPAVDVVKVAHHGSRDQDPRTYAHAAVGIIGVGENSYGHPTDELLAVLADAGIATYRTDRDGLILVAPGIRVWTARGPPPQH